jgi:hypothetical protein
MAPSLCGYFLQNKRAVIAFTWTLTTILTLVAFILALVLVGHVHAHYMYMEHYYQEQYASSQQQYNNDDDSNNNNNNNKQQQQQQHGNSQDERTYEQAMRLAHVSSRSMTFVAVYTMSMAVALVMYGSTAIVGFTSLRGVYIAPCFSSPGYSSKLKVGIFGGAILVFANVMLVCAVVFGEVKVNQGGNNNNNNNNASEPFEVERIAMILAICCMFLSALYTIFAILLFLFYVSDDNGLDDDDDANIVASSNKVLPSISTDPRRENFITMPHDEDSDLDERHHRLHKS